MKDFIAYFRELTQVSSELEKELLNRTVQVKVKKGEYLHRAGSICTQTYWIKTGLLRTFYLKNGKEITDVFAAEGRV